MNALRRTVPLLALAALAAVGCMLTSGQFVATYELPDPLNVTSSLAMTSVDVDLNTVREYHDHKSELKRVEDLSLVGNFTNNTSSAAQIEVWIVPDASQSQVTLTPQQLAQAGTLLWGPLAVAGNSTEKVDWDRSAGLFVGRQALIDEVKGDGHFLIYVVANGAVNGTYNLTVTKGSLIVVVGAAI
jgi:hypothetical protein